MAEGGALSKPQPLQVQTHRYAVVTGANKGIGFEISKKLASKGITVILTSRNTQKGLQALQTLKQQLGLTDDTLLVFHQLDVLDSSTVHALVQFINANYGKLDILVNSAGVSGIAVQGDPLIAKHQIEEDITAVFSTVDQPNPITPDKAKKPNGKIIETVEDAQHCIRTNFYGAKTVTEALIPLLKLSDSPKIVNVSSKFGLLKFLCNEWGKELLSNEEQLTEEKVDQVVEEFLEKLKEGSLEANGWPAHFAAYKVGKACLNAHTRIMAKKHPEMCINCVCPGFARTDMTGNEGPLSAGEAAEYVVAVAVLADGGPSGVFFNEKEIAPF